MERKIFLWFFFSLICCNLFAQFNKTGEFRRIMSKEPVYLKKAEKKIRNSDCYKRVKKQYPSVVNGKIQIVYDLRLNKELTREEFTYRNIMDNLEFLYYNNRKYPNNHVYLYDAKANVEISYEEDRGVFCSYDYDGSGGFDIEKYNIPVHVTIDNMQPDFVFMAISVYYYFLVKGNDIYVLSADNNLMSLNDFIEKYFDRNVKNANL